MEAASPASPAGTTSASAGVAEAALAVAVDEAVVVIGTGRTGATSAIHIRLVAVHHVVSAAARDALTVWVTLLTVGAVGFSQALDTVAIAVTELTIVLGAGRPRDGVFDAADTVIAGPVAAGAVAAVAVVWRGAVPTRAVPTRAAYGASATGATGALEELVEILSASGSDAAHSNQQTNISSFHVPPIRCEQRTAVPL